MSSINPGDVVRVSTDPGFSLDDEGSTATDPAVVTLTWYVRGEPPTVWAYPDDAAIEKDDIGVYHADLPIERVGEYHYRWAGAGTVDAAEEGSFTAVSNFGG